MIVSMYCILTHSTNVVILFFLLYLYCLIAKPLIYFFGIFFPLLEQMEKLIRYQVNHNFMALSKDKKLINFLKILHLGILTISF